MLFPKGADTMGRSRKAGIDYFPVDVNLMSDTRIRVLYQDTAPRAAGCIYT